MIRRSVGVVLYVAFLVLLVEGACRLAWPRVERSHRLANGVFAVAYLLGEHTPDQTLVSHPYMLFATRPNFESMGFHQTNSLGYRNATEPRADKGLRILALGGSTTWSFPWVPDPSKAWTSLLEKDLRSRHSVDRVEVLNAGVPYATSAEILAQYVFRGQHLHPDLVIFHEGLNDVIALAFPNYSPEYTHVRQASNLRPRPLERPLLKYSYAARVAYAVWLQHFPAIYVPQPLPFDAMPRPETLRLIHETYPEGFRRNVETLIKLARANGSRVLLVGFLLAPRERIALNFTPLAGLEDGLIEGVGKHNAIMAELAARYADVASYVSIDASRFQKEWFDDFCHLNEAGEREKERQIAAAVDKVLAADPKLLDKAR